MTQKTLLLLLLSAVPASAAPDLDTFIIEHRMGGNYGVGPFAQYHPSYSYGVSMGIGAGGYAVGPFFEGAPNHVRRAPGDVGHAGAEFYDARANMWAGGIMAQGNLKTWGDWRLRGSLGLGYYQMSYWRRCIDRNNGAGCVGNQTMQRVATVNSPGLSLGVQFIWKWIGVELRMHRLVGGTRVASQGWFTPALAISGSIW